MKLLIHTLTLLIICQSGLLNAQSIVKNIVGTDSCYLSLHKVVTKEMVKPLEQPYEQELLKLKIANEDSKLLLKKASKKSSYQDSRAMLTHHNIVFSFYKDNTICYTIHLSTLTGNIEIRKLSTQETFYSRVSNKFGRYLIKMFKKYKVYEMITPSYMRGGLHKKNAE